MAHSTVKLTSESTPIPFLDLKANFESIRTEVVDAVLAVLDSQQFILGPPVRTFEAAICKHIGCNAAIGCASGSDALLLSLLALDVRPGDEVITTPFTFFATAGAIVRAGATPVFVDIDPETFNIDTQLIEEQIRPKTRAIIAVHLFGRMANCDELIQITRKHGLALIEDAAQAIGATYKGVSAGCVGHTGCFSFFPSKNLGGAGDGGMVVTNDAALADRIRMLRAHGSRKKYHHELAGINSRLDTLQAAILQVKLKYLDDWAARRRDKAAFYGGLLTSHNIAPLHVTLPAEDENDRHVFNQYVVRCDRRDALRQYLSSNGLPTEVYYPLPLHLQPAFADLGYQKGAFPESEAASESVLALPIYPELEEQQQLAMVRAMAEFYLRGKA
jgi:dTDP-4-amino-4,6-dideoxygalactose transaminase